MSRVRDLRARVMHQVSHRTSVKRMADVRAAMRYHQLVARNANDTTTTWARDICREVHESKRAASRGTSALPRENGELAEVTTATRSNQLPDMVARGRHLAGFRDRLDEQIERDLGCAGYDL